MAVKTPPPPKSPKGEPPSRQATREDLSKPEPGKTVALNFRVPAEVTRDFKIVAATHEMTQSELLVQAFREWHEKHG
jgi:hypothetical protein